MTADATAGGRVTWGVFHVFDLDEPQVRPLEESMLDAGFAPLSQLVDEIDSFETWSQICLKFLTGDAE